jgi:hypothetical protein
MKRRKTITAQVTEESGRRNFWTRSELRAELGKISNKTNKPMTEATFKRRLAVLEEECPEIDRSLCRKFSDFSKWCLLQLEEIFLSCDRDIDKTRNYLQNTGINTDEYFKSRT